LNHVTGDSGIPRESPNRRVGITQLVSSTQEIIDVFDKPSYQFQEGDAELLRDKWNHLIPLYHRFKRYTQAEKSMAAWYSYHADRAIFSLSESELSNYEDARERVHLMLGGASKRLNIKVIERPLRQIVSTAAFLRSSSSRLLDFDGQVTKLVSETELQLEKVNKDANVFRKQAEELTKRIGDISSPLGTFKFQDPQTTILFSCGLDVCSWVSLFLDGENIQTGFGISVSQQKPKL
jgi:hypothetical protein